MTMKKTVLMSAIVFSLSFMIGISMTYTPVAEETSPAAMELVAEADTTSAGAEA
ncbi:hypothetical protein H9X85_07110 [Anaerotignum lactatifermentans]|uniref:Uncharacterized protein n=1 Tax=Anaerotignum lactatifermentans TaxID=160404 RepID=A0ABS2GAF1_9FIRM|nr:hypothetical protein [Anaerotignum lactatifermentans]MBM6829400.1 hypothetical protein [Anaerotignum lactatifermentans]MBM6877758.1 hypothetical protein [Anaerotignum lactatifermentans]MBM6950977.1 hypothetical protein [Anaerotignum lactatifermentans]